MATFSPGDKVSFINDRLNGLVKYRIDKYKVLVVLDDGFEIPVEERELVLAEPKKNEDRQSGAEVATGAVMEIPQKLYAGFAVRAGKGGNEEVEAWLLNHTPARLMFAVYVQQEGGYMLISHTELQAHAALLLTTFPLNKADSWRNWTFYILPLENNAKELQPPRVHQLKLRPVNLLREKQPLPFIDKEGMLMALDEDAQASAMQPTPAKAPHLEQDFEAVKEVVDLHFEALGGDKKDRTKEGILQHQLSYFENVLEKAVAQQMPRIIFIHGIGNGVLKQEIRNRLSRHPEVEYFDDAEAKKFGYGATAVYLKLH